VADKRLQLTALDRLIGWLSPEAGLKRAAARAMLRSYEAATPGRRTEHRKRTNAGPEAAADPYRAALRAQARDFVRNDRWAPKILRTLHANVWGTGIVPRLAGEAAQSPAIKRAAMDAWARFDETCDPEGRLDFGGLGKMAVRAMFQDGEVLIRLRVTASGLKLQVLEADHLDSSRTSLQAPNGNRIINGVEYAGDGTRAAYWLYENHPGETDGALSRGGLRSVRVPAHEVIHLFEALRPGQVRGVSVFAPALMTLGDLGDLAEAALLRQKLAACFGAFVKSPAGPTRTPLGATTTDSEGRRVETLSPGLVQYLDPGDEVTFPDLPDAAGLIDFMKMELHAAASATGITYAQLTGDLSSANYSSLKAGRMEFFQLVDDWQWHTTIPVLCRPVWRMVQLFNDARPAGAVWPAEWMPPARPLIDPPRETSAMIEARRAGLTTLERVIAQTHGVSLDEHLDQLKRERDAIAARGLVLTSDAASETAPSADPAAALVQALAAQTET